jgi:acyl-CoA dehydrogenase
MLPTEQALSVAVAAAVAMANDDEAQLRILTPLVKYRACRDNVPVATGAMEMRGGNGYIEDWVNAKLVRDAHLGLLWEGTSSVNALDIVRRAVGRERAHTALAAALHRRLDQAPIPGQFRGRLAALLDRAVAFVDAVANRPNAEASCRRAASALYHASSAALLAAEGAELGKRGGDARRLILARLVLDHRLGDADPFALPDEEWEATAAAKLLDDDPLPLSEATALLAA